MTWQRVGGGLVLLLVVAGAVYGFRRYGASLTAKLQEHAASTLKAARASGKPGTTNTVGPSSTRQ